jgi:hypothetical protein
MVAESVAVWTVWGNGRPLLLLKTAKLVLLLLELASEDGHLIVGVLILHRMSVDARRSEDRRRFVDTWRSRWLGGRINVALERDFWMESTEVGFGRIRAERESVEPVCHKV